MSLLGDPMTPRCVFTWQVMLAPVFAYIQAILSRMVTL